MEEKKLKRNSSKSSISSIDARILAEGPLWPWTPESLVLLKKVMLLCGVVLMVTATARVVLRARDRDPRAPPRVLVCYYDTPRDARSLQPAALPARLCTHINVAFARVRNNTVHLDPAQLGALRQVVALKQNNSELKVLVSVGGAGDDGFVEMVADHASRKQFIRSIKSLLHDYTLDGIDLDWEFPTGRRQRTHFSLLLREIRMEYNREHRDYLLTVAVVAEETIATSSYDLEQLNCYADFLNVMSYDYHFFTRMTPFTGLNSPLYAEPDQHLFLSTLNVNYTMHMYLSKGVDPEKLVIGIPTYGHSFKLVNPSNVAPGSPAAGPGRLGAGGFVSYSDACVFTQQPGVARARDAAAAVPYAHAGVEWLSFDDEQSVASKAQLAARLRLRGAMVYSLGADDHAALCAPRAFPLVAAVRRALRLDADAPATWVHSLPVSSWPRT